MKDTDASRATRTRRTCILPLLLLLTLGSVAESEGEPLPPVRDWEAFPGPEDLDPAGARAWREGASGSRYFWEVYEESGVVRAREDRPTRYRPLRSKPAPRRPWATRRRRERRVWIRGETPPFLAEVRDSLPARRLVTQPVEDGWIIGFEAREKGSSIWWFSTDGKKRKKLSDDHFVEFLFHEGRLYVLVGERGYCIICYRLEYGSLNVVRRTADGWELHFLTLFDDDRPVAIVPSRSRGEFLIAFASSFGTFDDENGTRMIGEELWRGLYPHSVVQSPDGTKAYVGMKQYVAEVDLVRRTIRFLLPDRSYLNPIPEKSPTYCPRTSSEVPSQKEKSSTQKVPDRRPPGADAATVPRLVRASGAEAEVSETRLPLNDPRVPALVAASTRGSETAGLAPLLAQLATRRWAERIVVAPSARRVRLTAVSPRRHLCPVGSIDVLATPGGRIALVYEPASFGEPSIQSVYRPAESTAALEVLVLRLLEGAGEPSCSGSPFTEERFRRYSIGVD